MKIFLDTANLEEIRQALSLGVIDGVTTNPTLIAKEKRDIVGAVKEISGIIDGPISAEVLSLDCAGMIAEGQKLAKIHENVVVKIPATLEGLKAAYALSEEEIPVNMTLIFSANQALLACKAGVRYVSPFAGRLDDIGHNGIAVASLCQDVISTYDFETEVIAASIRHPLHAQEAAEAGIDIITVPYKVLLAMLKHPLTDLGVEQFIKDSGQ